MNIEKGMEVRLNPENIDPKELREELKKKLNGDFCPVRSVDPRSGMCMVLLPEGVVIDGHSHLLPEGRHYLDLNEMYLQPKQQKGAQ